MASETPESRDPRAGSSPTVSWFELFYDLVVVAALGLTNDVFLDKPTLSSAVLTGVTMTALAWVWFLTALYNNMFPGQDLPRRLLLLIQMGSLAVAGLAVDQEHGIDNSAGLIAYGLALAIVATLIVWGSRAHGRPVRALDIAPLAIATAICLAGAFDSETRSGWYLVAAMLVSMLPILLSQFSRWSDASMLRLEHLRERLGLFVLIVLGEGFAQLLSALHFLGAIPRSEIFVLLFVLSFAVWWIYFDGTFSQHMHLERVRWRLSLLAHLTLVFGISGTLDILILLTAGEGTSLGDAKIAYFVACLAIVLFSFAVLGFTAKGQIGVQGWLQVVCGLLILGVGLIFVHQDDTSADLVIGLSAAIVVANAVLAVWADVASERHQWRSSLGFVLRGRQD